jgi:hypothetical protein
VPPIHWLNWLHRLLFGRCLCSACHSVGLGSRTEEKGREQAGRGGGLDSLSANQFEGRWQGRRGGKGVAPESIRGQNLLRTTRLLFHLMSPHGATAEFFWRCRANSSTNASFLGEESSSRRDGGLLGQALRGRPGFFCYPHLGLPRGEFVEKPSCLCVPDGLQRFNRPNLTDCIG